MTTDAKISARLSELIQMGLQVLGTRFPPPPGFITSDFVNVDIASQWAPSTSSLLARVFGESSQHYIRFQKTTSGSVKYPEALTAMGVLRAAKDDYDNGYLFDVRRLVEAEIFDDFLEQAEHLLANGYFQAAAVVAGCVLEDAMRKACAAKGVTIGPKPKLDTMNAELVKVGLYNVLVQKQITAIADLRNRAAHGQLEAFTRADVDAMLPSIRRLLAETLT